jgi:hypothetical protein
MPLCQARAFGVRFANCWTIILIVIIFLAQTQAIYSQDVWRIGGTGSWPMFIQPQLFKWWS